MVHHPIGHATGTLSVRIRRGQMTAPG